MKPTVCALGALLVVALVGASGVSSRSAAGLDERLPEASNLLRLINMVNSHERLSLDDVLSGYKDYVRLYEMQTELASNSEQGSTAGETRYELIGQVLQTEGLAEIAETLFAPFNGAEPKSNLSGGQRSAILKAIEEISSQW